MIAMHRVQAYMLRHIYEIIATFDRKFDIVFWPTVDLLVFGLLSVHIQRTTSSSQLAGAIIGGLILWSLVYSVQRDISVSLLEDAWCRNLYNLFATPLTISEMLAGTLGLSFLKALVTMAFTTILAALLFGFNLFALGPVLAFYILNIFVFGWAFGLMTASLIFRFGTRVQIFAWSLIAVIYPVSGVFYPLTVLPAWLAVAARLLPVSYIFEGLRDIILRAQSPPASDFVVIVVLNLCYLAFGIWLFVRGFRSAKKRGWFIHPS